MRVVHACWPARVTAQSSGLVVWAEDSTLRPTTGRRGRRPRISPHPYALDAAELADVLGVAPAATAPDGVVLDLPTRGGSPLPSPELVREDEPRATGPVRPRGWRVPAVLLEADQAYAWLSELDLTALAYGASVHHLVELVAFADDLVSRGRMLPTVLADGPAAVWRPLLSGPDAAWARVLAAALPPALLAAADPAVATTRGDDDVSHGEAEDPIALWADALDNLVDAAARAALGRRGSRSAGGYPGSPRLAGRADRRRRGVRRRPRPTSAELAAALARWQRDAVAGPVRACFRLVEPAADPTADGDGDDDWRVRFGLQAADEPSLVVDADAVWRARAPLPALGRHGRLAAGDLPGRAGQGGPALPGAGRRPAHRPPGRPGAGHRRRARVPQRAAPRAGHGRVRRAAAGLVDQAVVPAGAQGDRRPPRTQPGTVATAAGVGLRAIAEFRYDLAVGDDVLTADELAELAELKAPLVRLRGQWVELDARRLAAG